MGENRKGRMKVEEQDGTEEREETAPPFVWHPCQSCYLTEGMTQGWNAQKEPWDSLGSTDHLNRWGWSMVVWLGPGETLGRGGYRQALGSLLDWRGLEISTENICPGVWPLHQDRGWTGTGKANQVVLQDLL